MSAADVPLAALVCGGRDYHEERLAFRVLDMLRPTKVISGGAKGADALGEKWAKHHNIPCQVFKAQWSKHGPAAGPIRNQQMLDEGKPDLVVAFPGNDGTADMVQRAWSQGFRTVCVGNWWAAIADPQGRAIT